VLVAEFLDARTKGGDDIVWDLGANTGVYSRIAAKGANLVVSFDLDPAAVEQNFRRCTEEHDTKILPIVQDFSNPSPAIGWNASERSSLHQRGPADIALALALTHHFVIGGNVPLPAVAQFFQKICRSLIIEFVPKEDSQVQRMLGLREDVFTDYSLDVFELAFKRHFNILRTVRIAESLRTLYLMESK
jgi:ribosomal protein L11 methylase PrmA